jgi:SAM-dependent methyltransferase
MASASEVLELPKTLPHGWTQVQSKSGKPYYVHAQSQKTQWDWPADSLAPFTLLAQACADPTCLADIDIRARASAAAWLKSSIVRELISSSVRCLLDMGCGEAAYASCLARSVRYFGWDTCPASLAAAKQRVAKGIFTCVDMCSAGEVLPPQAPASACDAVLCMDAAQFAFSDAASARRWARRIRALLAPAGFALLLVPCARTLVDRTGNGCIEFLSRGRVVCKAVGAPWPSRVLDVPVYGAGYTEYIPSHAPGAAASSSAPQTTSTQWLVTPVTLQHACASVDLRILGSCGAPAFLSWCGIGQPARTPEAQARRDRAYSSWSAEMGAPYSANVALTWEEMQLQSIAVLCAVDAPETVSQRWELFFRGMHVNIN